MELPIMNKDNKQIGKKKMPSQFSEAFRPDLIKRAVIAIQRNNKQPYGALLGAGMRHSAKISRRRLDYKGSYGLGISRVPRKIHSGKGSRWNWVGAVAPHTVGGRRAHPPKPSKIFSVKVNNKERKKAIRSALYATLQRSLVQERGHHVPDTYPFLLSEEIEQLQRTKDVLALLLGLGFSKELERASVKKVRAGKGKFRNRKYKKRKSLLLVVSEQCPLQQSAKNISGIDIVEVTKLNAALLAPGTRPGRATLFSQKAVELIEKKQLFQD